jgi:XTP/dITP diphosphohydrolase
MPRLMLASRNPGKLSELHALLAPLPLELLTPDRLKLGPQVEETGRDYAENARLKARTLALQIGEWTLADDTGLEVEALEGAPGLHSARFGGAGANDADRRARLLEKLDGKPRPWRARFCCAVALSNPDGEIDEAWGECPGEIVNVERGAGGFGYDPIFLVRGMKQTMAELSMEQKNTLSHRARAIEMLWPVLVERMRLEI